MNHNLLNFKDLQIWTGYKSKNKVIEVLQQRGIKYTTVKNGVSTTLDALNAGMGIKKQTTKREISL